MPAAYLLHAREHIQTFQAIRTPDAPLSDEAAKVHFLLITNVPEICKLTLLL
jgi:hypothetical protein